MDLSRFSYGIFDIDGTLIDTMPTYQKNFAKILWEEHQIPEQESKRFYFDTAGITAREAFKIILTQHNITPTDEIVENLILKFQKTEEKTALTLFEDVKKVLRKLKKRKIKIFATSGNQNDLRERLKKTGILNFFTAFIGSEKTPKSAKHIEYLAERAAESVGLIDMSVSEFTDKAFLVGDGNYDMKIAKECGIYAIGITNTVSKEKLIAAGADKVIHSLTELV